MHADEWHNAAVVADGCPQQMKEGPLILDGGEIEFAIGRHADELIRSWRISGDDSQFAAAPTCSALGDDFRLLTETHSGHHEHEGKTKNRMWKNTLSVHRSMFDLSSGCN